MQFDRLERRAFITLLGGAAAWPLAVRGQQIERMRRVGILMNLASHDPEGQTRVAAFLGTLSELGWTDRRNVSIETCWGAGDPSRFRRCAAELVALTPEVILAGSAATMGPLLEETRAMARKAAQQGDDGTNDLLVSSVIRTNESQVWFVAEHVVDTPLVHADGQAAE